MSIYDNDKATVSYGPTYSGDGYAYGRTVYVNIGGFSISLGDTLPNGGPALSDFAHELAGRWNAVGASSEAPARKEEE